MKTIITSNSRPLHRALCTLLIGIAALWTMPRSARAQLYVSQVLNGGVGKYNATTGAAINANFITGLSSPKGLALSGNNLFVTNFFSNTVGEIQRHHGSRDQRHFRHGAENGRR
jgi:DNA-binding beta-propeller fold protein YncE